MLPFICLRHHKAIVAAAAGAYNRPQAASISAKGAEAARDGTTPKEKTLSWT